MQQNHRPKNHRLQSYKNTTARLFSDAFGAALRYTATVDHAALDGEADTHPVDDSCPRAPQGVDPNPDGKINDKGCVEEVTDVVRK